MLEAESGMRVCKADDGLQKWITASSSFKCTYSLAPPPSVRQRLRAAAVLNIEDSRWGHLIQGPSLSLSYADLDCLLHMRHVYCGKQASEVQRTGNWMALLKQRQIRF